MAGNWLCLKVTGIICVLLAVGVMPVIASNHVSDLSGTYRFSPDMASGTAELFARYGGPVKDYVNMYLQIDDQLTSQDSVLQTNQRVCTGSTIQVQKGSIQQEISMRGGFETESCPGYRPFVTFVDKLGHSSLEQVKNKIEQRSFSTNMPSYSHSICSSAAVGESVEDKEGAPTGFARSCTYSNKFICERACDVKTLTDGLQKTQGEFTYKAVETGEQQIELQCGVDCILHVNDKQSLYGQRSGAYGYMDVNLQQIPQVSKTFSLTVQKQITGPSLSINEASLTQDTDGSAMLSLTMQNAGDVKAFVDDISMNGASASVVDEFDTIAAGEERELMFSFAQLPASLSAVSLDMAYSSNAVNCQGKNTFSDTYNVGSVVDRQAPACSTDAECDENLVCCNGACRPPAFGVCEDTDGDGQAEWISQRQ